MFLAVVAPIAVWFLTATVDLGQRPVEVGTWVLEVARGALLAMGFELTTPSSLAIWGSWAGKVADRLSMIYPTGRIWRIVEIAGLSEQPPFWSMSQTRLWPQINFAKSAEKV